MGAVNELSMGQPGGRAPRQNVYAEAPGEFAIGRFIMAGIKLQRFDGCVRIARDLPARDPRQLHRRIFRENEKLRAMSDGLLNPPAELVFKGADRGDLFDGVLSRGDADN